MNIPFAVPDWMPEWVPVAVLVPALLYLLAFLAIPFSMWGLRRRLEVMDARLDELHGEIRLLNLRFSELSRAAPDPARPQAVSRGARPEYPAAPARHLDAPSRMGTHEDMEVPPEEDERPAGGREQRPGKRRQPFAPPPRTEPRIDWSR